jgi:transglutaminase-like putative cysteine protease
MVYRAIHTTSYRYSLPVSTSVNEARLTLRQLPPRQSVRSSKITVQPEPASISTRTDYFGNIVQTLSLFEPHDRLTITSTSIVEVLPRQEELGFSPGWEEVRERLASPDSEESLAAFEYVCDSPFVTRDTALADYARPSFAAGRPIMDAVRELTARIKTEFKYKPRSTTIDTPVATVLEKRAGVCQDFAHLMIGSLRSLGLAARYVSGYLRSGPELHGFEASHAWVAVYVPGSGWAQFDPTNDVVPSDGHLVIGWGRDYGDVTPIKGITLGGGEETIAVDVRVRPIDEVAAQT